MGFWRNFLKEALSEKRFPITGDFANQLELEYGYKKTQKEYKDFVTNDISIKKEPSNPHDSNALAVYAYNLKLGYIPKNKITEYKNIKNKRKETVRFYYDKMEDSYKSYLLVSFVK
jgi:hypothetical protein